eukprot:7248193-Prymnesium_polylepis.1
MRSQIRCSCTPTNFIPTKIEPGKYRTETWGAWGAWWPGRARCGVCTDSADPRGERAQAGPRPGVTCRTPAVRAVDVISAKQPEGPERACSLATTTVTGHDTRGPTPTSFEPSSPCQSFGSTAGGTCGLATHTPSRHASSRREAPALTRKPDVRNSSESAMQTSGTARVPAQIILSLGAGVWRARHAARHRHDWLERARGRRPWPPYSCTSPTAAMSG